MIKIKTSFYITANPVARYYDVWFVVPQGYGHPVHNQDGQDTVLLTRTELKHDGLPSNLTIEAAYGDIHKAITELVKL